MSEVEDKLGERVMAGDGKSDVVFVANIEFVELVVFIIEPVDNEVDEAINGGNGVVADGDIASGEDVRNSLSETGCVKLKPLALPMPEDMPLLPLRYAFPPSGDICEAITTPDIRQDV